MKKLALLAAIALVGGTLFAQSPDQSPDGFGPGPDHGPGMGRGIEWKLGTVVTIEYKKVSGVITLGQTVAATFKADGVEYQIQFPRNKELGAIKNGDTITVEGTFTTVKSDTKVPAEVRPFKITFNGKEIDVSQDGRGMMRGGMMRGDGRP
jgi:hypothetical protein